MREVTEVVVFTVAGGTLGTTSAQIAVRATRERSGPPSVAARYSRPASDRRGSAVAG